MNDQPTTRKSLSELKDLLDKLQGQENQQERREAIQQEIEKQESQA